MDTAIQPTGKIAFHRWGGAAFMLGNLLFIVNKLDEMSRHFLSRPMSDLIDGQTPGLILIGQAALIIGYLAFYRQYVSQVEGKGKVALRMFQVGGILVSIGHAGFISPSAAPGFIAPYLEWMFMLVLLGMFLLVPGLIWFGVLNLRRAVMSGWKWLPLFTGLMGFLGFFLFSGEQITATFLFFRTLFALGLIGLGFVLWQEQSAQA